MLGYKRKKPTFKKIGRPLCLKAGRPVLVSMYAGSSDSGQHAESAHCNYYMGRTGCRAPYVASST